MKRRGTGKNRRRRNRGAGGPREKASSPLSDGETRETRREREGESREEILTQPTIERRHKSLVARTAAFWLALRLRSSARGVPPCTFKLRKDLRSLFFRPSFRQLNLSLPTQLPPLGNAAAFYIEKGASQSKQSGLNRAN